MNGFMSLVGLISDGLCYCLELALFATFSAGLLGGLVLLINLCFRRWLTAGQMGLMWALVLLRLAMPIAPPSVLSLQNLAKLGLVEVYPVPQELYSVVDLPQDSFADGGMDARMFQSFPVPRDLDPIHPMEAVMAGTEGANPWNWENLILVLPWSWAVVGGTLFLWTLLSHRRFCRSLEDAKPCDDPRLLGLWKRACQKTNVRYIPPLLVFDEVHQPAILGEFHPRLLLPSIALELNDGQLEMIMLHELGHVKRRDIAVNWALLLLRAIHWWNPIFWVAADRFQTLREQACDAFALKAMQFQSPRDYGELLLILSQRNPASGWRIFMPVSILGFFSSYFRKRAVANRLRALPKARIRRGAYQGMLVFLSVILVGAVGLTDGRTEPVQPDSFSRWFDHSRSFEIHNPNGESAPSAEEEPLVTRVYQVEKALARISRSERIDEEVRNELKGILTLLLKNTNGKFHQGTEDWAQKRIRLEGTVLTIEATPKVQKEIEKCIAAWEKSGLGQICFEARLISASIDLANAIGIPWKTVEATNPQEEELLEWSNSGKATRIRGKTTVEEFFPMGVMTLDDSAVFNLIRLAQSNRRTNIMQAPKITTFNGVQCTLMVGNKHHFMVGFKDGGPEGMVPRVAEVEEGFRMSLHGIQSADGKSVNIGARLGLNHITDIVKSKMQVGKFTQYLQLPRWSRRNIEVSSALQDGQSLLIGCFPTNEKEEYLYVLLTVRNIVENEEIE